MPGTLTLPKAACPLPALDPATAAALDKPLLVCQGGRDYQATVADDL